MKRTKRKIQINTLILALGIIVCVTLRAISVLLHYDPKYGYFSSNALKSVGGWCMFAFSVMIIAEALINLKRRNLKADFTAPITYIPAGLCAAGSLFVCKYLFEEFAKATAENATPLVSGTLFLGGVFALLSIGGFLLIVLNAKVKDDIRALGTLAISVFLLLFAGNIYFDTALPLNAPNKIADQTAYIFAALFFLFETRPSIGRAKWGLYAMFGGIASLLCAYSSIPSLIAYFAKGYTLSTGIYESILTFTLFIYITARLILLGELVHDEPCELVAMYAPLAKARDEEVSVADRNFEELMAVMNEAAAQESESRDEDQLTIGDILDTEVTENEEIGGAEQ